MSANTTIHGNLGQNWLLAIPPQDLDDILRYVGDTWEELKRLFPDEHTFALPEPVLTLSLCERLDDADRKYEFGINASFSAESFEPKRVNGKIVKNGRTDIRIVLGARGVPELIMEFKKLNGTPNHRDLYCSEGVARFVIGKYSPKRPSGIMCGLVNTTIPQEAAAMQTLLSAPAQVNKYACRCDDQGRHVFHPSSIAPATAHFDTVHDRSTVMSNGPITIAHLFLDCP